MSSPDYVQGSPKLKCLQIRRMNRNTLCPSSFTFRNTEVLYNMWDLWDLWVMATLMQLQLCNNSMRSIRKHGRR